MPEVKRSNPAMVFHGAVVHQFGGTSVLESSYLKLYEICIIARLREEFSMGAELDNTPLM